jgi:protocadherin alpha
MDFSGSMKGDKTNLVTLASELMTTMRNITEDYRLGLGSFVDKPVAPFGATTV